MRLLMLLLCLTIASNGACKRNRAATSTPMPDSTGHSQPAPPPPPSTLAELERDPLAYQHEEEQPVDHLQRARDQKAQGDFEDALIQARCALLHEPEDGEALELISQLAELTGDKSLAIDALERLAHLQPDDAAPLIREARLLVSLGRLKQARQIAREAIDRDGENPESYQVAGRTYLAAEELPGAIAMFQKAIALSPEHGYALNNLGFAYLRANRNQEAVDVLTRAAKLLPHLAYVHNNLGVALERVGEVQQAKLAFARAVELSPTHLKAQLNAQRLEAEQSLEDDPLTGAWAPFSGKAEEYPLPAED